MKRKTLAVIIMIIVSTCLISCGDNTKTKLASKANTEQSEVDNDSQESSNEETSEDGESNKEENGNSSTSNHNKNDKKSTSTNAEGKKQIYKEKLDTIQSGLSDLDSYYNGSTAEMKYAASEEYKRWDDALNEIYGELKKDLSKDKMSALEKEETNWINEKESKAKEASEEYKGGTAEGLQYTASLAESTKNRCYDLVDRYMR